MPEPIGNTVAVAPKTTVTDVAEQQDSIVNEVIDQGGNVAEGTEETSEASEDSSTSTEKTDDAVANAVKAAEAEELDDDIEQFMKPKEDDKTNVQKRIDQLTAQIKELRNENSKLKVPEGEKKPVRYSEDQLKGALKKAFDEGDHELAWEVMKEQNKYAQEDLINMYEGEKNKVVTQHQATIQEWNRVCHDYNNAWATDDGKELYQGASQELNVGNGNSLLYKLAMKFYNETVDENGQPIYHSRPGGQRMAVADALNAILKKRRIAPNELKTKRLERSLAKAKRKATTPSTSSSDGDVPRKMKSTGDSLADYVAERRAFRNERT